MSDIGFHQTGIGRTFYQRDVPAIAEALAEIAKELKALNEQLQRAADHDDSQE